MIGVKAAVLQRPAIAVASEVCVRDRDRERALVPSAELRTSSKGWIKPNSK